MLFLIWNKQAKIAHSTSSYNT